jgi:hypothetical protein
VHRDPSDGVLLLVSGSGLENEEVPIMELAPGETNFTTGPCDFSELIVRDLHGNEIAKH